MPTADPVKNLMFVKESKKSYVQKEKIGVKEFNRIHSNRENWSQKQVEEEYKKNNTEGLAKKVQKQENDKKLKHLLLIYLNIYINKLARNAIIKAKQDKGNELISELNQQRQLSSMNE